MIVWIKKNKTIRQTSVFLYIKVVLKPLHRDVFMMKHHIVGFRIRRFISDEVLISKFGFSFFFVLK